MSSSNEKIMAALMEQMGGNNSKMELLTKILAQQNSREQNTPEKTGDSKFKGQMKKLMAINKDLKDKVVQLKKHKAQLLQYLDYFIEVNACFAGAVGACECWGDDPDCEKCRGQGKPGSFAIQEQAFQYYIDPVLKKSRVPSSEQVRNTHAGLFDQAN